MFAQCFLKRALLAAVAIAGALGLASCGGGGAGSPVTPSQNLGGPLPQAPGAAGTSRLLYVPNFGGTVTVYRAELSGDVPPDFQYSGAKTQLSGSEAVAIDSHGNVNVTNQNALPPCSDFSNGSVTVFQPPTGNISMPIRVICGSQTGLFHPHGIAIDGADKIYVADPDNNNGLGNILVYPAGATGDVPPAFTLSGAQTNLHRPFGIALDGSGNIFVTNATGGLPGGRSVTVYSAGASGNTAPTATIAGSRTLLSFPQGIAVDAIDNIYVADLGSCTAGAILVFAAGANGNVAPKAVITGPHTGLRGVTGVAVDSVGTIYATNFTGVFPNDSVTVYPLGANGDVTPTRTITGGLTGLVDPEFLAVH